MASSLYSGFKTLKMLYGHRPYWWLTLNRSLTDPDLSVKQYPLTCETGPGSPSGHCMVSVASLTPIITYFYHRLKNRNHQRCLITLSCLVFGLIAISRCYLAAHFPHQVILGLISGITVGLLFSSPDGFLSPKNEVKINWLHVQTVYLLTHPNRLLWLGFGSFMFAYVFSVFLEYGIKVDPNWSITLAQSACLQPEWIHLSTSLMMGFSRIAGTATGMSSIILISSCYDFLAGILFSQVCLFYLPELRIHDKQLYRLKLSHFISAEQEETKMTQSRLVKILVVFKTNWSEGKK
uniref:glucose-6-phosphatase n=1 Tax=Schistosoma mansoni TaxID=6183 RepID=A0A5K4ELF8_SCHMA